MLAAARRRRAPEIRLRSSPCRDRIEQQLFDASSVTRLRTPDSGPLRGHHSVHFASHERVPKYLRVATLTATLQPLRAYWIMQIRLLFVSQTPKALRGGPE
jgi:hypothetical protein